MQFFYVTTSSSRTQHKSPQQVGLHSKAVVYCRIPKSCRVCSTKNSNI